MKKIILFLVAILLLLNITIPVYSEVDDVAIKETTLTDNIFEPMYVAMHPCHSGKSHAMCDIVIVNSESCGCELFYLECCCGRIMAIINDYCEKHQ